MAPGRFIVFEGGDGTGKTTQARLLAAALKRAGGRVLLEREPGGPPSAEALRQLLLAPPAEARWEPLSEALLHYTARAEHLQKTIVPALAAGSWVVCDRFADSTEAYQGGGLGLPDDALASLRRLVVGEREPDLVLVLDLDPALGRVRTGQRAAAADRYERMDAAFHQRVRDAFLRIAARGGDRYAVIDAGTGIDAVQAGVRAALTQRLACR